MFIVGWSITSTLATVFTTQLLLNESTFSIGVQRILLNMAICGIVMGAIYIITARLRNAVIIGMFALLFFTAANYFVFKFRGSELCPADFLSVGTAATVVDRYTFSIDAPFAYAIILAILFSATVFCIKGYKQRNNQCRNRIICAVSVVAMILGVLLGSRNIVANHFLQTGSVQNGYLLNFVLEIEENIIKKPDGYDAKMVHSLEEEYDENAGFAERANLPVIITIMNESFVDLNVLGNDIETNIEVLPFFDSLGDNTSRVMRFHQL